MVEIQSIRLIISIWTQRIVHNYFNTFFFFYVKLYYNASVCDPFLLTYVCILFYRDLFKFYIESKVIFLFNQFLISSNIENCIEQIFFFFLSFSSIYCIINASDYERFVSPLTIFFTRIIIETFFNFYAKHRIQW